MKTTLKKTISLFLVTIMMFTALFCFSAISTNATGTQCGDSDGDGDISITDITYIQKYVCELIFPDDDFFIYADVNRDGSVDIKDATYLQKYLVNIISTLPKIYEDIVIETTTVPATTAPETTVNPNNKDNQGWNNQVIKP